MTKNHTKNGWKIVLLCLLGLVILTALCFGVYAATRNKDTNTNVTDEDTSTVKQVEVPAEVIDALPTLGERQSCVDMKGDWQAIITKNIRDEFVNVSIYCYSVTSGYNLTLAKTSEGWVRAVGGQAAPKCSDLAEYKVSKEAIKQCYNDSWKLVDNIYP